MISFVKEIEGGEVRALLAKKINNLVFYFMCWLNQKEEREECESTSVQQQHQSRRPNLSSLEIPTRSIENSLSGITRIDIPSPCSTRSGLPPRPNSTKFRSSMRNLLPQRSFMNNLTQDGEKTMLIMSDTPLSDKPTTSRSFSLNKVFFSTPTKSAHSLPVTPLATSHTDAVQERQSVHDLNPKSSVSISF